MAPFFAFQKALSATFFNPCDLSRFASKGGTDFPIFNLRVTITPNRRARAVGVNLQAMEQAPP
jgi:hypothetical protein